VENPKPENHSPGKMNFQKNVQFEDRVRGISVVGSLEQFGQVRINFALGIEFYCPETPIRDGVTAGVFR
jgi:hypothetical protein